MPANPQSGPQVLTQPQWQTPSSSSSSSFSPSAFPSTILAAHRNRYAAHLSSLFHLDFAAAAATTPQEASPVQKARSSQPGLFALNRRDSETSVASTSSAGSEKTEAAAER